MTVLFVTSRYPFPLLKGDQVRAYHQITELIRRGHKVILVSFDNGQRNPELEKICQAVYLAKPVSKVRVLLRLFRQFFSSEPLQLAFFHSPEMLKTLEDVVKKQPIDVALLQLSRLGDYLPSLQKAKLPVVLDLIDSLAMNIELKGQAAMFPVNWLWKLESKRLFAYESKVVAAVFAATVVSEKDKDYLGQSLVQVNPNGVLISDEASDRFRDNETLLFHGNMSYYPNVEAAQFLVKTIMPKVWQQKPNCKVLLIGSNPSKKVSELASDRVIVTGFVEDVNLFLQTATLGVYPILRATGIQNKILEAMAEGLPVLSTSTVAEGIKEASALEHFYIEDDPEKMTRNILYLLNNVEERKRLSIAARELILNQYTWRIQVNVLEKMMTQAIK